VFVIEASSAADVHRRVGEVLRLLEDHGPFELQDSRASRLDPDREAVPA
jgi:hypothetical protein